MFDPLRYHLGTTNLMEPQVAVQYKSVDDLVTVYNLKSKKVIAVRVRDLSFDYDLVWYKGEWRYIMRKEKPRGV